MKPFPTNPSDDAAYRQYAQRVLEATSNQGLINKHSTPAVGIPGKPLHAKPLTT